MYAFVKVFRNRRKFEKLLLLRNSPLPLDHEKCNPQTDYTSKKTAIDKLNQLKSDSLTISLDFGPVKVQTLNFHCGRRKVAYLF